ncbi:MAG: 23S rRNA (guanosine(2251)-2'-O)-methyltransferase RlmB [Chloroflexi bacterium]|nr:MAG: 23S rRNA (guanosine(2251)-2'-O)-methyltransferase RlmB [Chloroflexota bacterium]
MRETLYGRQAVRESLRAGRRQSFRLHLAEGVIGAPIVDEIMETAKKLRIPTDRLSRHEMTSVAGTENHQGVALEVSDYPYASVYDMLELAQEREEPALILLLDLIQDVHNLGTLIRAGEAAGVHGIIIQGRRAAGVTPATVNTSSGAVEHLLVAQVTNLPRTIEQLKTAEVWIAGLEDIYGAKPYTEIDLRVPLGIVVGSEGNGLRRLVRERCDWLVSLPMRGQINSLNAAVAGSIVLYEVLKQRGYV